MNVSDVLRRELADRRALYNARFREAQFRSPQLDPEVFGAWLREGVDPVVEAVAAVAPDRAAAVVESLFDLSLSLIARDLVGPNARQPVVNDGWRRLLTPAARFVAADPGGFVPRIINALLRLAGRGARTNRWIEEMIALCLACGTSEDLFRCGRIAAWRAGLPELKEAAIQDSRALNQELAGRALGLSAGVLTTANLLDRLAADPWLKPTEAALPASDCALKIIGEVGAFRGFGGVFLRPPLVFAADDALVAFDGEATWLIRADCFGAGLFRLKVDDPGVGDGKVSRFIARGGRVRFRGAEANLPELAGATSAAANDHTLAVTLPLTHAVILVALRP